MTLCVVETAFIEVLVRLGTSQQILYIQVVAEFTKLAGVYLKTTADTVRRHMWRAQCPFGASTGMVVSLRLMCVAAHDTHDGERGYFIRLWLFHGRMCRIRFCNNLSGFMAEVTRCAFFRRQGILVDNRERLPRCHGHGMDCDVNKIGSS